MRSLVDCHVIILDGPHHHPLVKCIQLQKIAKQANSIMGVGFINPTEKQKQNVVWPSSV